MNASLFVILFSIQFQLCIVSVLSAFSAVDPIFPVSGFRSPVSKASRFCSGLSIVIRHVIGAGDEAENEGGGEGKRGEKEHLKRR